MSPSLAIGGGAALVGLAMTRRWRTGLAVFLAAGILINWVLVLRVLPSFEQYKPVPPITAFLEPRLTDDDVVAHYSVALPSMVYYLRRHIDVTYDRGQFLEILRQPRRVYAVLWTEEYERLRRRRRRADLRRLHHAVVQHQARRRDPPRAAARSRRGFE